jgi:putative ABC transport system permease protein
MSKASNEQPRWRRYLRFWGPDVEADVGDELSFHVDMLAAELRERGVSSSEARREALRRFGDYRAFEHECQEIGEETERMFRRHEWLSTLRQDVRFGFRQLRANPLLSLVAVVTLALGIGANTAIFSVVNGVLLRPLPYRDAERLVVSGMSLPEYRDFAERNRVFDQTAVWASNVYTVRGAEDPEEVRGAQVTPSFFQLLGAPALGRGIDAETERTPVAVLSHALWRRRFASDPGVLGRTIDLSGNPHTIVGVMGEAFQFPDRTFDVWVPLLNAIAATPMQMENRSLRIFRVIGHVKPGITLAQVQADSRVISEELARMYPQTNQGLTFEFMSLIDRVVGSVRPALWVLLGVVGLVLAIACANVANLLLGLTAARSREIAVRRALGAARGRLVRQLITESLVLAALGGALGVLAAYWLVRALPSLTDDLPRLNEITLDSTVLFFAIAASALTAMLFGVAPAVQGSRTDINEVLKEGGRGGVGMRRGRVLRSSLVAAEVAISVIVLVGASLFVRSLVRAVNQDIGFSAEQLVSASIGLFYFDDPAQRTVMLNQALERIANVPGVQQVAGGTGLPPQTAQRRTGFNVTGRTPDAAQQNGAYWLAVTPDYFATLGTRVIKGREFQPTDGATGAPVIIINESLARALFGESDPLGRVMQLTNADAGPAVRTIVGVVADVRYAGVENPTVAALYTPFAQTPFLWSFLMVRSNLPAERLVRPIRDAIRTVDPRMVPARVQPHEQVVGDLLATRKFLTLLLTGFALLALVLAAVGIYGVIAYTVTQRRREIGVRLALGAAPGTVIRQVVTSALRLVGIGMVIGLLASIGLTRLLSTMLYDVTATDTLSYLAGALLIGTIGLAAAAGPALKAAAVDPLTALRE